MYHAMLYDTAAEDTPTATKERALLCSFSWLLGLSVSSTQDTQQSVCTALSIFVRMLLYTMLRPIGSTGLDECTRSKIQGSVWSKKCRSHTAACRYVCMCIGRMPTTTTNITVVLRVHAYSMLPKSTVGALCRPQLDQWHSWITHNNTQRQKKQQGER